MQRIFLWLGWLFDTLGVWFLRRGGVPITTVRPIMLRDGTLTGADDALYCEAMRRERLGLPRFTIPEILARDEAERVRASVDS